MAKKHDQTDLIRLVAERVRPFPPLSRAISHFLCALLYTVIGFATRTMASREALPKCLEGLLHNSGSDQRTETRGGIPIYNGSASGLADWKFRVETRLNAVEAEKDETKREQKLVELASHIVDALTDEALKIAKDVGSSNVLLPGGLKKLIERIEEAVLEFKEEEARELYHWGAKFRGPLARQPGESMSQYIARRRRWESQLKSLDSKVVVSDTILADYLLKAARLGDTEQLMIKTAVHNKMDFDAVAIALRRQHPQIHVKETPRQGDGSGKTFKKAFTAGVQRGFRKPRQFRSHRKGTAYLAEEDEETQAAMYSDESSKSTEEAEDPERPAEAYVCYSSGPTEEFEDVEDQIEQDVVVAFLAAGADIEDKETCEMISECVHDEQFAFYSREDARSKGVNVKKAVHQFVPKQSELKLNDRKKAVDKVKKNSACRRCGKIGHWQSDAECPMRNKTIDAKGPSRPAHVHKKEKNASMKHRGRPTGFLAVAYTGCTCGAADALGSEARDALDSEAHSEEDAADPCPPPPMPTYCRSGLPFIEIDDSNAGSEPVALMAVTKGDPESKTKARGSCASGAQPPPRPTRQPPGAPVQVDLSEEELDDLPDTDESMSGDAVSVAEDWTREDGPAGDRAASSTSREWAASRDHDRPYAKAMPGRPWASGDDPRFMFGTHKGRPYSVVTENNPSYYFWAAAQPLPGKQLKQYIDWVEKHYHVGNGILVCNQTQETHTCDAASLPKPRTNKKNASTSKLNPDWKMTPKCDVCVSFTYVGSNAFQRRQTCLTCGTVTKTKIFKGGLPADPESCLHRNTNYSKSSKTTHRVTCVDCGLVLHEEPQETYRQAMRSKYGDDWKKQVSKHQKEERADVELSAQDALKAASLFYELLRVHCSKVGPDTPIKHSDLEQLLADAVDITSQEAVAYMHVSDEPEDSNGVLRKLEVVDPKTDPRVFVILDEACNRTCHTVKWAKHAAKVLDQLDRPLGRLENDTTSYNGLGKQDSKGRRKCPFGVLLRNGKHAEGTVMSNELAKDDHFMLLSLQAQATLGLVKDVADGTCFMKSYNSSIPLYEVKGSGLRAICISEFQPEEHTKFHHGDACDFEPRPKTEAPWHRDKKRSKSAGPEPVVRLRLTPRELREQEEIDLDSENDETERGRGEASEPAARSAKDRGLKLKNLIAQNKSAERRGVDPMAAFAAESSKNPSSSTTRKSSLGPSPKSSPTKPIDLLEIEGEVRLKAPKSEMKKEVADPAPKWRGKKDKARHNEKELARGTRVNRDDEFGDPIVFGNQKTDWELENTKTTNWQEISFPRTKPDTLPKIDMKAADTRRGRSRPREEEPTPMEQLLAEDAEQPTLALKSTEEGDPNDDSLNPMGADWGEEKTNRNGPEPEWPAPNDSEGSENASPDTSEGETDEDEKKEEEKRVAEEKDDYEKRKDWLEESQNALNEDEVPSLEVAKYDITSAQLDQLIDANKRSYNLYDDAMNRIFVKKHTNSTWVKITQWNVNCLKTVYVKFGSKWKLLGDRRPIDKWVWLDESRDCIVVVHHQQMVLPEDRVKKRAKAYLCEVMENNRKILSSKQRELVTKEVALVAQADHDMMRTLKNKPVLMRGCKTFILELFCGAMILSTLVQQAGLPISQPTDILLDGANLLNQQWRKQVEEQIERDDPFITVIPFPCGPWNSWTRFNASRFDHIAARVQQEQKEHTPMLKWVADVAAGRVQKGRIALLENGLTSSALDLSYFQRLEGLEDGIVPGATFEFVSGDQCMVGQHDRQSGLPYRGATAWGTNSDRLKDALGMQCDGTHPHQAIRGTNIFGDRSKQKAEWPKEMCQVILKAVLKEHDDRTCYVAFAAEGAEEIADEMGPIDSIEDDNGTQEVFGKSLDDKAEREQEMLDSLEIVGFPKEEAARRKAWMQLPRVTRASIRRLHKMLRHARVPVMLQILRGAGADAEIIKGVKLFKCGDCLEMEKPQGMPTVKPPSPYIFNWEVIIDVFYIKDMEREIYGFLSIVDNGTSFHLIALVSVGKGTPLSSKCYKKFLRVWTTWAGFPRFVTCDRGLHNRGAFARGLSSNGVYLRQGALEAPENIGRGERHGGIIKTVMKPIIKHHHAIGKEQMKMIGYIACETKNDDMRRGGYSPSQWVIARFPRRPGGLLEEEEWGQLGTIQAQADSTTAFGLAASVRFEAKRNFVKIDCGRRYANAMLRRARALPGNYTLGSFIMFRTEQGNEQTIDDAWLGPARIVGIEGKNFWLMFEGSPVCAAQERVRPASTAEMLAYQFGTRNMCPIQPMSITDSPEQVAYVDARTEQTQTSQVQKTTEAASTHEAAVPAPVAQPTISPEQLQLPEAPTFPGLTENIPSQEDDDPLVSEAPSAKKTKLTAEPELRVGDIAMPSTAEDPASRTPLEVHLENISQGLDDPGQRLARKLASTQKSGA